MKTARTFLGQPATAWRTAAVGPAWIISIWAASALLKIQTSPHYLGFDAVAYWAAARADDMYAAGPRPDSYHYSPVFAQLLWPLAHLPWPAFLTVWITAEAAAFLWLLRPLGWSWGVPAALWCLPEILLGNIHGFLAVVVVVGVSARPRLSAAWAVPLLTKITPAIGLAWHAANRHWRSLAVALATTATLTVGSVALDPEAWTQWWSILTKPGHGGGEPWLARSARLLAAIVLTVVAVRRRRRWILMVATLLALPVWGSIAVLTVLAGIPRLVAADRACVARGVEAAT